MTDPRFQINTNPPAYSSSWPDFDSKVIEYIEKRRGSQEIKFGKCIVVGDSGIGKTCIIKRFSQNEFMDNYKLTIGVDFEIFDFCILGYPFKLNVWDTAGEERFKSITTTYYRDSHVAIIVFDFSKINTLSSIKRWSDEVLKHGVNRNPITGERDAPLQFVVGTKKDLITQNSFEFIEEQAKKIAEDIGAFYWSVSSLTGENIDMLFRKIAAQTFTEIVLRESEWFANRLKSEALRTMKTTSYANVFLHSPSVKLKNNKFSMRGIKKSFKKSRCFRF